MFGLRRERTMSEGSPEINMAPLIDMVFILLIFFLVTTQFARDQGMQVKRPSAATGKAANDDSVRVVLESSGQIRIEGRTVSLLSVRTLLKQRMRSKERPVLVVADRDTRTQVLVDLMDECRRAGATKINLATEGR